MPFLQNINMQNSQHLFTENLLYVVIAGLLSIALYFVKKTFDRIDELTKAVSDATNKITSLQVEVNLLHNLITSKK